MSADSLASAAEMSAPSPAHLSACPRCRRRFRRQIAWLLFWGLGVIGVAVTIHPFLAVSHRVPATVLVVEGWLPDYAIEAGMAEFKAGGYQHIYTTGGPLEKGGLLAAYGSHAGVGAGVLLSLGQPTNQVTAVASGIRYRNRTLASAQALRDYFVAQGIPAPSFNIVTLGSHARRTQLCFQRAFGREAKVGIIAIENLEYEPGRWWAYSEGVKSVLAECLGLAYAWCTIDYGS